MGRAARATGFPGAVWPRSRSGARTGAARRAGPGRASTATSRCPPRSRASRRPRRRSSPPCRPAPARPAARPAAVRRAASTSRRRSSASALSVGTLGVDRAAGRERPTVAALLEVVGQGLGPAYLRRPQPVEAGVDDDAVQPGRHLRRRRGTSRPGGTPRSGRPAGRRRRRRGCPWCAARPPTAGRGAARTAGRTPRGRRATCAASSSASVRSSGAARSSADHDLGDLAAEAAVDRRQRRSARSRGSDRSPARRTGSATRVPSSVTSSSRGEVGDGGGHGVGEVDGRRGRRADDGQVDRGHVARLAEVDEQADAGLEAARPELLEVGLGAPDGGGVAVDGERREVGVLLRGSPCGSRSKAEVPVTGRQAARCLGRRAATASGSGSAPSGVLPRPRL